MLSAFLFALTVTLPNLLLLILGKVLRLKKMVSVEFCNDASNLVFYLALPLMLFASLTAQPIDYSSQLKLVGAGVLLTTALFILAECYAYFFVSDLANKGVLVQGVFRHNLGIAGLAMIQNAYGQAGIAAGAVYMGLITLLLNIYSVMTLSRTSSGSVRTKIIFLLKKISSNPLIIAIVIALTCNAWGFKPPEVILQTCRYLAATALPLALICAGATFDWRSIRRAGGWRDVAVQASIGRLVLAPVLAIMIGLIFGLRDVEMGVLFLMTATPVAAASYVMAKAMGSNAVAAANIMGITTAGSMFSASLGLVFLRTMGWM